MKEKKGVNEQEQSDESKEKKPEKLSIKDKMETVNIILDSKMKLGTKGKSLQDCKDMVPEILKQVSAEKDEEMKDLVEAEVVKRYVTTSIESDLSCSRLNQAQFKERLLGDLAKAGVKNPQIAESDVLGIYEKSRVNLNQRTEELKEKVRDFTHDGAKTFDDFLKKFKAGYSEEDIKRNDIDSNKDLLGLLKAKFEKNSPALGPEKINNQLQHALQEFAQSVKYREFKDIQGFKKAFEGFIKEKGEKFSDSDALSKSIVEQYNSNQNDRKALQKRFEADARSFHFDPEQNPKEGKAKFMQLNPDYEHLDTDSVLDEAIKSSSKKKNIEAKELDFLSSDKFDEFKSQGGGDLLGALDSKLSQESKKKILGLNGKPDEILVSLMSVPGVKSELKELMLGTRFSEYFSGFVSRMYPDSKAQDKFWGEAGLDKFRVVNEATPSQKNDLSARGDIHEKIKDNLLNTGNKRIDAFVSVLGKSGAEASLIDGVMQDFRTLQNSEAVISNYLGQESVIKLLKEKSKRNEDIRELVGDFVRFTKSELNDSSVISGSEFLGQFLNEVPKKPSEFGVQASDKLTDGQKPVEKQESRGFLPSEEVSQNSENQIRNDIKQGIQASLSGSRENEAIDSKKVPKVQGAKKEATSSQKVSVGDGQSSQVAEIKSSGEKLQDKSDNETENKQLKENTSDKKDPNIDQPALQSDLIANNLKQVLNDKSQVKKEVVGQELPKTESGDASQSKEQKPAKVQEQPAVSQEQVTLPNKLKTTSQVDKVGEKPEEQPKVNHEQVTLSKTESGDASQSKEQKPAKVQEQPAISQEQVTLPNKLKTTSQVDKVGEKPEEQEKQVKEAGLNTEIKESKSQELNSKEGPVESEQQAKQLESQAQKLASDQVLGQVPDVPNPSGVTTKKVTNPYQPKAQKKDEGNQSQKKPESNEIDVQMEQQIKVPDKAIAGSVDEVVKSVEKVINNVSNELEQESSIKKNETSSKPVTDKDKAPPKLEQKQNESGDEPVVKKFEVSSKPEEKQDKSEEKPVTKKTETSSKSEGKPVTDKDKALPKLEQKQNEPAANKIETVSDSDDEQKQGRSEKEPKQEPVINKAETNIISKDDKTPNKSHEQARQVQTGGVMPKAPVQSKIDSVPQVELKSSPLAEVDQSGMPVVNVNEKLAKNVREKGGEPLPNNESRTKLPELDKDKSINSSDELQDKILINLDRNEIHTLIEIVQQTEIDEGIETKKQAKKGPNKKKNLIKSPEEAGDEEEELLENEDKRTESQDAKDEMVVYNLIRQLKKDSKEKSNDKDQEKQGGDDEKFKNLAKFKLDNLISVVLFTVHKKKKYYIDIDSKLLGMNVKSFEEKFEVLIKHLEGFSYNHLSFYLENVINYLEIVSCTLCVDTGNGVHKVDLLLLTDAYYL